MTPLNVEGCETQTMSTVDFLNEDFNIPKFLYEPHMLLNFECYGDCDSYVQSLPCSQKCQTFKEVSPY